eukprot:TRINITY_DN9791_c0_g1_i1.p1 TRINITY_DN9791_c0_g1~~TRINITY_DN9791_c0_g1_i1.p1  ORF type:complete len:342 (+),score=109.47 TRINITY_DN9791_c0_g1_i1:50-1075(+)
MSQDMKAMAAAKAKLEKAQASNDVEGMREALLEAKAAGGDAKQIDEMLAEMDRLKAEASERVSSQMGQDDSTAARSNADVLKKKGNDKIKDGTKSSLKEAIEFYSAGIDLKCNDHVLNAQLYSNRAHARILLRQFVEAVDDCRKAIAEDPNNMKAYWRGAKASLNLDLCKNGIDFCDAGLSKNATDADLLKLKDACAQKLAGLQQRRAQAAASARSGGGDFNADEAMALQERVGELNEQLEGIKMQIGQKQREHRSKQATRAALSEVPSDTRMFASIGRTFVLSDNAGLEERLQKRVEAIEEELPKLKKAHEELEKRRDDGEKELREMIQAFQAAQTKSSS